MTERFFIITPVATDRKAPNSEGTLFPVFLSEKTELKWSGKTAPPAVGDRVYMRINSIGWGTVQGYAESHGYLGLLVKPENPPDWFVRQQKANQKEAREFKRLGEERAAVERIRNWPQWILDGICCVFGAEIGDYYDAQGGAR
jgi:hypothetical protein